MVNENFKPLQVLHISQAADRAEKDIREGLEEKQAGLKCRWSKVNEALLGSWRFNNVYMLAGASGHGKSYILNMLHQDFTDPSLNSQFSKPYVILHFCFEMSASDEVLRSLSSITKKSYGELLSAQEKLQDYDNIINQLDTFRNKSVYYVETSGNLHQIYQTIRAFRVRFPNHELVISLDHTLLTEYHDEQSEVQLASKTAKMFIDVRKEFHSLNIFVSQLNDKIEDPKRLLNKALHFPTKTDIHSSKQTYWACDYVWVVNRPELLGIDKYGRAGYDTNSLIALHLIKARKGVTGLIRLKEDLSHGNITQL